VTTAHLATLKRVTKLTIINRDNRHAHSELSTTVCACQSFFSFYVLRVICLLSPVSVF